MEENNRPQRRTNKTRPPYDLRRKVLLKNFLRVQMSPLPLQTPIGSLVNHEISETTSENEIVDIENSESTSDAMNLDASSDAIDPLNSAEIASSSQMEIDDEDSSEEQNRSSPSGNTSIFDFAKITVLKLSRFNSLKRKSPSLSAEAVKVIADKNSVHLESKEKNNKIVKAEMLDEKFKYKSIASNLKHDPTIEFGRKKGEMPDKESKYISLVSNLKRDPTIDFERKKAAMESKYKSFASNLKCDPTIEFGRKGIKAKTMNLEEPAIVFGRKKGIIKAKTALQSSKFPFKQQQVDGNKSSKLSKVRKMIAAVHNVIKGENSKIKNMIPGDNYFDSTRETLPQYENTSLNLRLSSDRSSKHGSFSNGFLFDVENEENDAETPERVRMIKAIKKRQHGRKRNTPYGESFRSRSVLKDPNNFVCKLLRRKTFCRSIGTDSQEQERSWAHSSDISWSLNEIRKLEKANKRLREENKLLSESLSSIMADVDVALGPPCKKSHNSGQSDIKNTFHNNHEPDYYRADVDTPRCKVLRSRSVQDRGERRREIKSRLSSRSMCHQQYSRISPKTLYRAKPCIINPHPSDEVPLPYPELPPILSASLERNCAKPISRRFSMLESMSRKPQVHRRSSFAFDSGNHSRFSLLSLPSDAFY